MKPHSVLVLGLIAGLMLIVACTVPNVVPDPVAESPACVNPSVVVTKVGKPIPRIAVARVRNQDDIGGAGTMVWDAPVATQLVWDSGGDWASTDEAVRQELSENQDMPRIGDMPAEDRASLISFLQSTTDPIVVGYISEEMQSVTIHVLCDDGRQAQASAIGSRVDEIGVVACDDSLIADPGTAAADAQNRFCPLFSMYAS